MDNYEVHGIDVSHYQSIIDWDIVNSQNIAFAFAKATEGESMRDSLFQKNWSEMKRVGIMRGAYHFFRPTKKAEEQALNFIETANLLPGDLPPVLDFEVKDGVARDLILTRIRSWLDIVEHHYNIRPIIYTNLKFYYSYIVGNFEDYPIWIARYSDHKPVLFTGKQWKFWQYGNRGRLEGIEGDVDFNVFQGTPEELYSMGISAPAVLSCR